MITTPLGAMPAWCVVALNVVGAGGAHAATGYLAHRLPRARLEHDDGVFRLRAVERDGRAYRSVRIARWKDHLPEAGALFAGGVSKRRLPDRGPGGLAAFAVETRRAELAHWWCLACAPLFVLWNPPIGAVLMVAYLALANLPCIAVQRYNRARVLRVLRRTRARSGRRGASMPNGSPPLA